MVDMNTIAIAFTLLVSVVASSLGLKYKLSKDKVTKLLSDVIDAVQDDTVSEEECQKVAADAKELVKSS